MYQNISIIYMYIQCQINIYIYIYAYTYPYTLNEKNVPCSSEKHLLLCLLGVEEIPAKTNEFSRPL